MVARGAHGGVSSALGFFFGFVAKGLLFSARRMGMRCGAACLFMSCVSIGCAALIRNV